jgi:hypothetical protein
VPARKNDPAPVVAEEQAKAADNNAADLPRGLHLSAEREVRVDDYPERPFKEAATKEQLDSLKEAGLL